MPLRDKEHGHGVTPLQHATQTLAVHTRYLLMLLDARAVPDAETFKVCHVETDVGHARWLLDLRPDERDELLCARLRRRQLGRHGAEERHRRHRHERCPFAAGALRNTSAVRRLFAQYCGGAGSNSLAMWQARSPELLQHECVEPYPWYFFATRCFIFVFESSRMKQCVRAPCYVCQDLSAHVGLVIKLQLHGCTKLGVAPCPQQRGGVGGAKKCHGDSPPWQVHAPVDICECRADSGDDASSAWLQRVFFSVAPSAGKMRCERPHEAHHTKGELHRGHGSCTQAPSFRRCNSTRCLPCVWCCGASQQLEHEFGGVRAEATPRERRQLSPNIIDQCVWYSRCDLGEPEDGVRNLPIRSSASEVSSEAKHVGCEHSTGAARHLAQPACQEAFH
mmetsp:Transcript_31680/g.87468  ORF Transcript_31680/g.87468 Transcript_31680/m.87468 type:complete len:392 (-) Transcript_31680:1182-2357(-)